MACEVIIISTATLIGATWQCSLWRHNMADYQFLLLQLPMWFTIQCILCRMH